MRDDLLTPATDNPNVEDAAAAYCRECPQGDDFERFAGKCELVKDCSVVTGAGFASGQYRGQFLDRANLNNACVCPSGQTILPDPTDFLLRAKEQSDGANDLGVKVCAPALPADYANTYTDADCKAAGWDLTYGAVTLAAQAPEPQGGFHLVESCEIPVELYARAIVTVLSTVTGDIEIRTYDATGSADSCVLRHNMGADVAAAVGVNTRFCNDPELFGMDGLPQKPDSFNSMWDSLQIVSTMTAENLGFRISFQKQPVPLAGAAPVDPVDPTTNSCAPPSALDGMGLDCECLAPNLDFGGGDCRPPTAANCAEHYDPPQFFDPTAGECGARLYPCHDSAVVKADNSGCECPDGTFAHGDPSAWSTATTLTLSAICHADHAPIQHYINGWLDSVFGNNPTLVAHFISDHGQDPDGNNALHSAARNGYYSAAKALIEGGADIDRKRNGEAPLHMAVRNERGPLITLLLQRGANPDIADGDGDTPLHDAARRTDTAENVALISFLLDKGADPNTRNDDGWRPLDLAYHGGTPSDLTWQARRGIMAALIAGGATWSDECTSGAIPNENYRPSSGIADCVCPLHISERDSRGRCECPAHSHSQVNGRCLPKDSAQVEAEILKMEAELLRLRASLVSLNARLSAAAEMPREAVEEIAEQAGDTAQEIKRRRDNFLALARADLAGAPPPPVAMSDTAAECRMLGGEVQIHSATGIRVCSGIDANDTFCLVDSGDAYPCRGLFRHVRTCNDDYNRRALNPFFCGAQCGEQAAKGDECE